MWCRSTTVMGKVCILQLCREVLAGIIVIPALLPQMRRVAWHLGLVLCPICSASISLLRSKLISTSLVARHRWVGRGSGGDVMHRVAHHEATPTKQYLLPAAPLGRICLIQRRQRCSNNNSKGLRTLNWEVLELIILLKGWGSLLVLGWSLSLLGWLLCWGLCGCHRYCLSGTFV